MKQMILIILVFPAIPVFAQGQVKKLYNPDADARVDLGRAVARAKMENKHVFIQIGGNWCSWCFLFHDFCAEDGEIETYLRDHYISLRVNYSRENQNLPLLADLGFPQRFGFPVFVIVDQDGDVIHIQDSALLEEGKGYNRQKVLGFFKNWSVEALDSANYN